MATTEEYTSELELQMTPEDVPELDPALEKELLSKRIKPVFITKKYRKVAVRRPQDGTWEVAYLPKRKKTWTAQSAAGFQKACEARQEKCKLRKQQRMQEQIAKLQEQLALLKDTTEGVEDDDDEEDESSASESEAKQTVAPVTLTFEEPKTETPVPKRKVSTIPDAPKKKMKKV